MRLPKPIATGVRFQSRTLGSVYTAAQMKAYAAKAVEAEREACARVAESMRPNGGRAWDDAQRACFSALTDLAEAIRARGSNGTPA